MSELAVLATDLSQQEAANITHAIQAAADDLCALITRAWHGRAWHVLGYGTWDIYCATEFEIKLALPKAERQQFVRTLRSEGMSTRAIGAGLGVHQSTVIRDLPATDANASVAPAPGSGRGTLQSGDAFASPDTDLEAGAQNWAPDPALEVTGVNGKTYAPTQPRRERVQVIEIRGSAQEEPNCVNALVPPRNGFVWEANERLAQGLAVMHLVDGETHAIFASDLKETRRLIKEIARSIKPMEAE